jgi:hypothetical protein
MVALPDLPERRARGCQIIKLNIQRDALDALLLYGAGEAGFEPTNGGSKVRCLTTWRLPNVNYSIAEDKNAEKPSI